MNRKFKILAGVLMVVLVGWSVNACDYYCNSCDDCEAKITAASAGGTICLTQSINNYPGTCINNPENFNNKIFDCQGNTIDGDDSGNDYGIYLYKNPGNTIRNCVINDFAHGIFLDSSFNLSLIAFIFSL